MKYAYEHIKKYINGDNYFPILGLVISQEKSRIFKLLINISGKTDYPNKVCEGKNALARLDSLTSKSITLFRCLSTASHT